MRKSFVRSEKKLFFRAAYDINAYRFSRIGVLNMVKLSKAGKMPCKSWSLQARETCPGSVDPITKVILPVCEGCYATQGNYNFDNVKEPRAHNREDWKRTEWVTDMIAELETERYFRWFDSGDIYHPALAFKIFLVIQGTPWVKHWLPTKSYTVAKIRPILERIKTLPNVVVRYSSPNINGEFTAEHGSVVIPTHDTPTQADFVCGAYERDGKCGTCRACWKPENKVIAYPAHGRVMISKVKKLKLVA